MSFDGTLFGDNSSDVPLFGDDASSQEAVTDGERSANNGISDWQIERVRQAFDASGIVDMDQRKRLAAGAIGRSVDSLRDLTPSEVTTLVEWLARSTSTGTTSGSSWDNRDEDTWIDRL